MKTKQMMQACHVVEIVTPNRYVLNGLWFGPKKPKRVIIFIHGLTASLFSMRHLRNALVGEDTAVLTFNNRGFEQMTSVKRKQGAMTTWVPAGGGREKFTECADDIEGAIRFARTSGVKEIYLAGHSTGSQKAVYWASRKRRRNVIQGIVLLGPLSDWAGTSRKYTAAITHAKHLICMGKPHELMPSKFKHWFQSDAQRFLSLYTPDSVEEIFTYAQPTKSPRLLRLVRIPILAVFAGADEFGDRSAKEIAAWFEHNICAPHKVIIVPRVKHSFSAKGGSASGGRGAERVVARAIRQWILAQKSL